mmetsp:Transcript_882/g.1828  ORF Transcript_882/g.1828 Transcript_882/m.1828 type:complete len:489 (-) Transcript_882:179-1645(-)|eukprot:CAMPEP_0114235378 /NCGR_PEP_ID=MMETSP0058-20121206/6218_1 /TAXON_ID=36894 /ORGANISM="Pyramimonas parkeae, CCMP726" /LENGTH=488 /DNA_ID=CAMNT_0001347135 /DNA_START=140 /DNA_END=1606 /DNA_ORIENTATION=+
MSLTFKFPSWQVRITDNGVHQSDEVWETHQPSKAWNDDLESLSSDVEDEDDVHTMSHDETFNPSLWPQRRVTGANGQSSDALCIESRCHTIQVPMEVLALVAAYLAREDVLRCMRTCRDWHAACRDDALWGELALREGPFRLDVPKGGIGGMHWVASSVVGDRVGQRFMVLRRGYHYVRDALHARWSDVIGADHRSTRTRVTHVDQLWDNHQQLEESEAERSFPTKTVMKVIAKLTTSNWSLLYEGIVESFTDRAQRVAFELRPQMLKAETEMLFQAPQQGQNSRITLDVTEGMDPIDKGKSIAINASITNRGRPSEGIQLWNDVIEAWEYYRVWLRLAGSFSPKLTSEVEHERQRSFAVTGRPRTPRVIDYGAICFRTQVLLSYQLRGCLQHSIEWLAASVAAADEVGWANCDRVLSEGDLNTFIRCQKLLQELDVADDAARSEKSQDRMRVCFASAMGGAHPSSRRWATFYSSSNEVGCSSKKARL